MLKFIKPTLLAVIMLEIASIFFMLNIYDKFISDPRNYTSTAVVNRQARRLNKTVNAFDLLAEEEKFLLPLPKKFLIASVPFTVQSPDSKWDEYGEEACEEMSEIIVDRYWRKLSLDRKIGLVERNKLIEYEIQNYGDFHDEDAKAIARRLQDYFGYQDVKIIYDFSLDDLKREIIEGRPIIVPLAGRKLNNPYFTQPGPLYHALVVVGFDGDKIIVNDPGIGKGEGYRYNENVFYGAIHDFPGSKERIEEGRKAMIIVEAN